MKTKFDREVNAIGLALARALLEEAMRTAAEPRGPYEVKERFAELADDTFKTVAGVVSDTSSSILKTAYNDQVIETFRKQLNTDGDI
jgi:hypothetical protein